LLVGYAGGLRDERFLIVWPFGYSARNENGIVVFDEDGVAVARVGDSIELGGGSESVGGVSETCSGRLWSSGNPIRIIVPAATPVSTADSAP
jgi:hypothetical protein